MLKVAVIGAGLSGLTLAKKLKSKVDITLFEKARGPGGRLTTRRADPYAFDHGAQYFIARSQVFQQFIEPYIHSGILAKWEPLFAEISGKEVLRTYQWTEQPHYVGVPGMNALAKALAKDIPIRIQTHIASIEPHGKQWVLFDQDKQPLGEFDWVISTAPSEQSKALINQHLSSSTFEFPAMHACFSMMLGFEEDFDLGFEAAIVKKNDISWIAKNHSKPGRKPKPSLLVNSTNLWANQHIDLDTDRVLEYLYQALSDIVQKPLSKPAHSVIHRWRYANIGSQSGALSYLDANQRLALCGDWFIKGRVESAFLSALDLSKQLESLL